ncbi:hypothetical protein EZV73_22065 [Acidaminobacter sp. JC074]|uniref:hypothetical protein n=1 Tax=Acidaminobacter sp. JC074 TaxID=2530199 RepID=UPI001F0D718C|nr:hypothetical protein [Acidaminobacter sp. JC074]MCH4890284.1 hypothetical protein [Acidaminobacter sp. JC074]
MGLLGDLLKLTGTVVGATSELVLKGTGEIIGAVADEFGADELADASRAIGNGLGDLSNAALTATGQGLGTVVDVTIDVASELGGGIGEAVADGLGATYEEKMKARKIGAVVGGASAGFLVGDVIGGGITAVAASGTASTGAAISGLSGAAQTSATLAQIGGGAVAAGGGGVAAGTAILNGINVATTLDGAKTAMDKSVYKVTTSDDTKRLTGGDYND